jgi:hypothetical protein
MCIAYIICNSSHSGENKKGVNTELLLASIQEKVADSINAKQAFFQKNEHKILRSAQIIGQF